MSDHYKYKTISTVSKTIHAIFFFYTIVEIIVSLHLDYLLNTYIKFTVVSSIYTL